ncbi:MAG: hypothetical protein J2P50_15645 [Hyphomicrobiaceae bacterium]|nr:hypothetical protein [Hyphomicrobiaceae bacterium]
MGDFEQGSWGYGARLIGQGGALVSVATVAAFNGSLYSPIFDSIFYYIDTFARGSLFYSPQLYLYLTSVFISLMTLLIAGIPAALYERIRGLRRSTQVSLAIWLVAAILLSLPTIMNLFGEDY